MNRHQGFRSPLVPIVGGVAAVVAAGVLLAGVAGLVLDIGVLRNWLAVLLALNAGVGGLSLSALDGVNLIDVLILLLAGLAYAGFWPGPGRPHKMLMALAVLLPLVGIVVLFATAHIGRSGLMGGGLVLALSMIANRPHRALGLTGTAANALLLAGDFATNGTASALVAAAVAEGYLLLIIWLLWIGFVLLPAGGRQKKHSAGRT